MSYGTGPPRMVNYCPNCGEETQTHYREIEIRGETAAASFCDDCWEIFYAADDSDLPITWTTDGGIVADIQLPATYTHDVKEETRTWELLDEEDWSQEDVDEFMDEIEDAHPQQGVRGDVSVDGCSLCGGQAAGDCQILGKVVCHSCFSDARQNPEKLRAYRDKLEAMYGEDELRDGFPSSWEEDTREETVAEKLAEERESDSERPDDFRKWSVEQWKDAYVDGEINLVALEIGVGHALEEEMDLSGPDSDKFERSIEIAEELSEEKVTEAV